MGLEADDGRPETSPPLRRGVQTADRAVVRERQAIPGDRGRVRHRAIDPAALGPRHPRPAVGDGGGRFRTSGAGIHTKAGVIRANAARYRRDAGCWASPIHLLLDDRASRDGACGSDRRRRARGPARQPRTLRRRKIKAALERKGVTASRRRIGGIMHEQGMTSAYTRRRFKPHGTRVNEAKLANLLDREFDGYAPHAHLASDLTYVRVGGQAAEEGARVPEPLHHDRAAEA